MSCYLIDGYHHNRGWSDAYSIIPIAGLIIAIYETYTILPIYDFEPYKELLLAVIFYSILLFTTAKPLTLYRKIKDDK